MSFLGFAFCAIGDRLLGMKDAPCVDNYEPKRAEW